jgi:hypothetical protein
MANETFSVQNTEISKGAVVRVRSYGGEILERRVWEVTGDAVFVCAEHVWEALASGIDAAPPVGFPIADVELRNNECDR